MIMQFLCSKETSCLFDNICEEKDIMLNKTQRIVSLQDILIKGIANYAHVNYFVLDLNVIRDRDDEILDAFRGFMSMYNARIIVLAFNRVSDDSFIKGLIDIGIYNIILNDHNIDAEMREVLSAVGKQYKDAMELIERQTFNTANTVKVGIVGTDTRVGTTTQALLITKYFKDKGQKACYVEADGSEKIESLITFYELTGDTSTKITYSDIDIIYSPEAMDKLLSMNYEFFVLDFGRLTENNLEAVLSCDTVIFVGTAKPWELSTIARQIGIYGKQVPNLILNYVPEFQRSDLNDMLKININKVYFSNYTPSPFELHVNDDIYNGIFKKHLVISTPSKEKKLSLFGFKK